MEETFQRIKKSEKRRGNPIPVPTNRDFASTDRYGLEEEARSYKKSKTKNLGYKPSSSPHFSNKPLVSVKFDRPISTNSFYGNSIETSFTDKFIYKHRNKEKLSLQEKRKDEFDSSVRSNVSAEIINIDDPIESDSSDEVYEKVQSKSAPSTLRRKGYGLGEEKGHTRVASLKTKPLQFQGSFSKLLLSRIKINDDIVIHSRHILRIHEEISLTNDGGVYQTHPVRSIEVARYNDADTQHRLVVIIFKRGCGQWICEIDKKECLSQFRRDVEPFIQFELMSDNDRKTYQMILNNQSEFNTRSLRRKSEPIFKYDHSENQDAQYQDTEEKKEKFHFRSGRDRPFEEEMFIYPFTGRNRVTILVEHALRLSPMEYLNDAIIEFYIKESSIDFGYNLVKSWTNKVDIFEKDFIVIPINENFHWYMAIVVNPKVLLGHTHSLISDSDSLQSVVVEKTYDSIDSSVSQEEILSQGEVKIRNGVTEDGVSDTERRNHLKNQSNMESQLGKCTCIIFDSLPNRRRSAISTITKYFQKEAEEKKNYVITEKLHRIHAKVPRQPNHCDCGVYLLQFFEQFMTDPEGKLRLIFDKNSKTSDWFNVDTIDQKRRDIFELVQDIEERYHKFICKN